MSYRITQGVLNMEGYSHRADGGANMYHHMGQAENMNTYEHGGGMGYGSSYNHGTTNGSEMTPSVPNEYNQEHSFANSELQNVKIEPEIEYFNARYSPPPMMGETEELEKREIPSLYSVYYETYVKKTGKKPNKALTQETQIDAEIEQEMSDWSSTSIYFCKICYRFGPTLSHQSFQNHLMSHHDKTIPKYLSEFGALEIKVQGYFKCVICGKDQIKTKGNVSRHLSKKHNLNLRSYFDSCIRTNWFYLQSKNEVNISEVELNLFGSSDIHMQAFIWASKCQYNCSLCGQ